MKEIISIVGEVEPQLCWMLLKSLTQVDMCGATRCFSSINQIVYYKIWWSLVCASTNFLNPN